MEAEIKKVLGIILIITGLLMFYWDISESYYYFAAKKEFPQVFLQPASNASTSQLSNGANLQDQMNAIIGQQINEQIKKLIPANTITQLLNVSVWSIFAFFLIYAGAKIIGIGRDFLKDSREDKVRVQALNPPL
ncbi:MAG: hypothetical protein WC470_00590 [Candidatus Paceibacterota bacterium]